MRWRAGPAAIFLKLPAAAHPIITCDGAVARRPSRLARKPERAAVMRLHDRPHIHGHDLAVADYDLAIDDRGSGLLRRAEEHRGDGIVQSPRTADGVEIEGEEVSAFARLQRADIGAPQDTRATEGGKLKHF